MLEATTYPIGTLVNCNRCNNRFPLTRERKGQPLHTTASRLSEFETCPHCQMTDTHWVYLQNNPRELQLVWTQSLLEFTFDNKEQWKAAMTLILDNQINCAVIPPNKIRFITGSGAEQAIALLRSHNKRGTPKNV